MLDGKYTIEVIFTDSYNRQMTPFSWNFTVLAGEIKSENLIKKQSSSMRTSYNAGRINSTNLNVGEIEYRHDLEFDWLKVNGKVLKSSVENNLFQP